MKRCVYLDNAGCPLVHPDLVDAFSEDLKKSLLGNPHSKNSISQTTSDLIDHCRDRILQLFDTNSEEYSVIFTSNCTAALKLVGECFDWSKCSFCMETGKYSTAKNSDCVFSLPDNYKNQTGSQYVYTVDNHTSVVGVRQYAVSNGASVYCIKDSDVKRWLADAESQDRRCSCSKLFAYPAQSNFCGRKYPLEWTNDVKRADRWFVCLDAAAFVPTSRLDLSRYKPDFVALSFYKIFGFPTGLGALLVKNFSCSILIKRYFGGGTAASYLPGRNVYKPRASISDRFEDGTIPVQQIVALKHCFQLLEKLGGITKIGEQVYALAKSTFSRLSQMRHANGNAVAKIYCYDNFSTFATQGPILNFNLLRSDGSYVGYAETEKMADLYNIQFRTGCFCNQGACQTYLHTTDQQLLAYMESGKECGDVMDLINGQPLGSVRISFGFMSTEDEVKHFLKMIYDCFLEKEIKSINFDAYYKKLTSPIGDISNCISSPETEQRVKLTDILVFPIKSCAAIRTNEWPLSQTGLLFDRHWMVTNEDGLCMTQKREPSLALIKPSFNSDWSRLELNFNDRDACFVEITNPENDQHPDHNYLTTSPTCQTKVCADKVSTLDSGETVAEWISLSLNRSYCRLVSQIDTFPRLIKKSKTESATRPSFVSLANEEQYLLVNRASIRRLLTLIKETNPEITEDDLVARFRPNLVVDGGLPFEEDSWKSVAIKNLKFTCVGKCTRCQMICINQETGETEPTVLISLRDIKENKVTFGIYLRADNDYTGDVISVGDKMTIDV